ncbi:Gfo/Idh/MocA family protein [Caenimonas terrae]|uniref:Gfo/Idh/MocA family protein n=1 Tax=Caenimonas terrae TaxID=696074 RepID=A0ABW0NAG1_9BURK
MARRAPLRLAVAGLGAIGRAHVQRVLASGDCTLVAVTDPAPAAQAAAREAGVPLFEQLEAMLDASKPDGVILATPTPLHVAGALACIARGIPVLVEKPVADTQEGAQRLAQAEAASRVPVLVGHHRRYSPALEAARAVIDGGRLGRLTAFQGSATFRKPDAYFTEAPWRCRRGGGPILVNLVHEVDNMRALMGEIVQVRALASNAARGFEVEDTAAVALRFAGGALGTFLVSDCAAGPRSWEQTSGENQAYDRDPDEDCYVIGGDRGSLGVPTMRLRTYDGEASWQRPLRTQRLPVTRADPLVRQLEHFCAVIRGLDAPRVSAQDAGRTLRATLAVAESAAQGGAAVAIDPAGSNHFDRSTP